MSRVFIDNNIRHVSSLPIVAILGIAPLAALGVRFDLALAFAVITLLVTPLTAALLHIVHDLTDDGWLVSWSMLIAGFWVTIAEIVLGLVNPALRDNLGLFLPVLAVSPLILVQVQLVRRNESFGQLFRDSAGMSFVFAVLLSGTALLREVLGNGTITLLSNANEQIKLIIPGLSDFPIAMFASAAGGMLVLGFILAFRNWLVLKSENDHPDNSGENAKEEQV